MADRENIGLIFVCLLIVAAFGAGGLLILRPGGLGTPPPAAPAAPVLPNFPTGPAGTRWNALPDRYQQLTEAIEADPNGIGAYVERARLSFSFGDIQSALIDLESALEIDPEDLAALTARIEVNQRQGDEDAVLGDYDTLIRLEPGRPDLLGRRAWVKSRGGDPSGAVEDFTRALALRPGDPAHLEGRAWALLVKGEHAAAIADYDLVIALNDRDPELFRNRGFCRLHAGDYEQAVADFDQAIARGTDDASLRADRARALLELGNLEAALADADRAVARRHADQVRGLSARAEVYLALGRYDDALADLDRALSGLGRDAEPRRQRAMVHWARGDLAAARLDAQKAAELDPGDGRAALLRGIICYHERRWDEAERHLLRAVPGPGEAVRAAVYLHLSRRRGGNVAAAREGLAAFAAGRAAAPGHETATLEFLLGRLDEEALLAAAASATSDRDAQCAARFAAGTLRLLNGDSPGAVALFDRAVAAGRPRAHEYQSARTELR